MLNLVRYTTNSIVAVTDRNLKERRMRKLAKSKVKTDTILLDLNNKVGNRNLQAKGKYCNYEK